jgi:hypothetical protein
MARLLALPDMLSSCAIQVCQYSTAQTDMAIVGAREHRAGKTRSKQGFVSVHTIDIDTRGYNNGQSCIGQNSK